MTFTLEAAMSRTVTTSLTVYLLFLHTLLILLLSGRGRRYVPLLRQQDEGLKNAHFESQMHTFHRRIDEIAEPGSVLFVGASGIQGMNLQRLGGKGLNFGIGGDTTEGLLRRLPSYTSLKTAKAIVISIGFNDFKHGLEHRTIQNIEAILSNLPIGLPVVVCSIGEVSERKQIQGENARIHDLNSKLQAVVEERANVRFLDVTALLTQSYGRTKEDYLEDDGVHLNLLGRRVLLDAIVSALDSLLGRKGASQ